MNFVIPWGQKTKRSLTKNLCEEEDIDEVTSLAKVKVEGNSH